MEELKNYYNEHASQARQHEDQRERMTNIILSISGVLVGFVTFSQLSLWALAASIPIVILGIFGFYFAGKHYERFKFHTSIMSAIRDEIDKITANNNVERRTLSKIRQDGACQHYTTFVWPALFSRKAKQPKNEEEKCQMNAKSKIAQRRVHVFWEALHIVIIIIGLGLTVAIIVKSFIKPKKEPTEIRIVK